MYNRSGSHEALLSGAPLPTLLYFALPIILGNVFQQLYSIVDAVVVGKFLGDLPLSGISVASPIVDVANALIIGGTIGAGVLCAHFCGAEDWDRMRRLNATSLIGGAVLTALISAAGILLSPLLLRSQGTEEAVCQQAAVYLQLVFAGLIFCFLYNYYAAMLRFHEQRDSDCTIAVREVPLKEASRFGIMNTREDGSIYEFEEKPKKPKSTNASMGIYVFKWSVLKAFLEADEADRTSENDFGKNIIPAILNAGHRLYAYRFEGYWKDVGTISSLWEANMDLLGKHPAFDIYGTAGHKIYARNQAMPSSYIARSAEIRESFVAEGCNIEGCITHSIISTGCTVGKGVEISDSVIMPDVTIENGAVIRSAIIAEGCHIKAGARVGDYVEGEERKISVIGKDKTIAEGTVIDAGAIV